MGSEDHKQPAPPQKPPAKKSPTISFDTAAIKKLVVNMQRAANDAAVLEVNRSQTLTPRVVLNAFGQLFYRVGEQSQYALLRLWRVLGRLLRGTKHVLLSLAGALTLPLLHFFAGMMRDLTAPFRKLAAGLRNVRAVVREERAHGNKGAKAGLAYFRQGVHTYRHLLTGALGWLLPVAAAGVLVFTVSQVLQNGFSLQVTYEGEVLGFVENQAVWDRAKEIVRERIIASDTDEEWDAEPEFSIVPVTTAARSTATRLADDLISSSSDQIQSAVGVTVNGELYGVAQDAAALQTALNEALEPYQQPENPNHRVAFAQNIELIPGVYFTSSVTDTASVLEALRVSPETLQVKVTDVMEYDEEIAIEEQRTESGDYYEGTTKILQRGQTGLQHVVAEVTTVDGVEISRVPLQTTVLEEMVPRVVLVGTKSVPQLTGITGGGQLLFPVPGYVGISTRFGQGGHRGMDIRAPYGSPIYACDSGTVVEAGWHWSWGNYVKIDHGNGMTTLYAHCSALLVGAGQGVARGTPIGLVGSTGNSSGNHCHLEVTVGGRLTNPAPYIM